MNTSRTHTKYLFKSLLIKHSLAVWPLMVVSPVAAVELNYESLSSLEKPLAMHYGDVTYLLNGLVDGGYHYREESGNSDSRVVSNFQLSAETQLSNSWTLGAAYFGEYTSSISDDDIGHDEDNYQDNAAVYLAGVWGTLSLGNVTGSVREETRRKRGVGNARLSFDDQLGQLTDLGVAYVMRFGPSKFSATIDEDNGFELGGSYQRPLGNKDYRFTARVRDTVYQPNPATDVVFDSRSLGFVGELTYGSFVFDIGVGIEHLKSDTYDARREYLTFGAARKIGRHTLSGAAHVGSTEGQRETSYAIGLSSDIARGLSLNLGVNYEDTQAHDSLEDFLKIDRSTQARFSVRYSF